MLEVMGIASSIRRVRGVFYGWWLVGLAALIMIVGTVPLFQGLPAWNVVLKHHFGWSQTQLSLAFSLTRIEGSIMGPVSGYLIEKLGPRRMVLIGLVVLGGGFLMLSQVRSLWQFYLSFVVMSVGAGLGSWLPMMTVLNHWFIQRRATAMAWAMEGFSIGGILLVPVLAWAIDPDAIGRPGWRVTAAAIGIFVIVMAFPMSRLVRNRPEEYGDHPDGRPPAPARPASLAAQQSDEEEPDYTWQQAIRTRPFWFITMGHACSSIVIVTIMVHIGIMLDDRGFSLQMVGWIVSTYTAVAAVSTIVGGYIGDRVPIRLALFSFSALQSAAVVVLVLTHSVPMAFLFALLMGAGFGGRNPLTTAIRGVYFGRRAFASITGISMIPMNVLLLVAPLFAGYMRDTTGTYDIAFYTIALVSFLGSCLFLLLGEPKALPAKAS